MHMQRDIEKLSRGYMLLSRASHTVFLTCIVCLFSSCLYRTPTEDDISVLPMTNAPHSKTMESGKKGEAVLLPHVTY
jgi:hypothetical protein